MTPTTNVDVRPGAADPLRGLKVLVVEDEALVAMLIEDMLSDLGCEVLGPAGSVRAALELLGRETPDAAILDVNLGGEPVYPVAEALRAAGVPFVLATGYGQAGVAEAFREALVLQKPFEQGELERRFRQAVAAGS